MESLKKLEEICEKDTRQNLIALMDPNNPGTFRPQELKDCHNAAASIRLHEGVPEAICDHFETARNLIIYSWFYYPFNVTAELCAYTSVEYALKIRAGLPGKKASFRSLLQKAVDQGWISDAGFTVAKQRKEMIRRRNQEMPPEFQSPEPAMVRDYCEVLIKVMPSLRNSLAHGTSMLHNHGASGVHICAELINQLFEVPKAK